MSGEAPKFQSIFLQYLSTPINFRTQLRNSVKTEKFPPKLRNLRLIFFLQNWEKVPGCNTTKRQLVICWNRQWSDLGPIKISREAQEGKCMLQVRSVAPISPYAPKFSAPSTPRLQLKCLDLNLTERCHKSGGGEFRQIAHRPTQVYQHAQASLKVET